MKALRTPLSSGHLTGRGPSRTNMTAQPPSNTVSEAQVETYRHISLKEEKEGIVNTAECVY